MSTKKNYYGLKWTAQSCYIDSTLMALFFHRDMYAVFFPFLEHAQDVEESLRSHVIRIIRTMREPERVADIGDLRTELRAMTKPTQDHDRAFQKENKYGYVYYFLQEFLRLFSVPPLSGRSRVSQVPVRKHIVEITSCDYQEGCRIERFLREEFNAIEWDPLSLRYLIVEFSGDLQRALTPELTLQWESKTWKLYSMIVFDCSHFITYLLSHVDSQWYVYDDGKSRSHTPLVPMPFGAVYRVDSCQFRYGKENTFFFYLPT